MSGLFLGHVPLRLNLFVVGLSAIGTFVIVYFRPNSSPYRIGFNVLKDARDFIAIRAFICSLRFRNWMLWLRNLRLKIGIFFLQCRIFIKKVRVSSLERFRLLFKGQKFAAKRGGICATADSVNNTVNQGCERGHEPIVPENDADSTLKTGGLP